MKTYFKSIALVAALAIIGVSSSFASHVDFYLKITGSDGSSKIVKLSCPNGTCSTTVDGLTNGKYSFTLCTSTGTPLAMKVKEKANRTKCSMTVTARERSSGMASGKAASTTTAIVSPRDAASGLPTGKRQHKPFNFVAELDRTQSSAFVATGDLDGDGSFDISFACTNGGISAMDDWQVPN